MVCYLGHSIESTRLTAPRNFFTSAAVVVRFFTNGFVRSELGYNLEFGERVLFPGHRDTHGLAGSSLFQHFMYSIQAFATEKPSKPTNATLCM